FLAWWWTNRRIPFRSRLYGFLLVGGGALIVEPLSHASIGWWGLLLWGLPIVLTAWVLWMIVAETVCPSWLWQRSGGGVVLTLACSVLSGRAGLDSNLRADRHWRWNPSAEELFLAEKERTADGTPALRASAHAGEIVSLGLGDWPEFRGPNRDGVIRGT